jgi:hypothetical protein
MTQDLFMMQQTIIPTNFQQPKQNQSQPSDVNQNPVLQLACGNVSHTTLDTPGGNVLY